MLALWLTVFAILAQFKFTRSFLQKYPDLCSFNMFKVGNLLPESSRELANNLRYQQEAGPSEKQMAEASFVYWFFAYGYSDHKPLAEQHSGKPTHKVRDVIFIKIRDLSGLNLNDDQWLQILPFFKMIKCIKKTVYCAATLF